jgi:hypothetical protein
VYGEHRVPVLRRRVGCDHLIGESDDQIQWSWGVICELKRLCEEAIEMKIDIGKLAKGIRGFKDLTPATQDWIGDYVPELIVDAPGIRLVANRGQHRERMTGCLWTPRKRQGSSGSSML